MESSIDMTQQIISNGIISLEELVSPEGTEIVCIINKNGRIEQSIIKIGTTLSEDKKEMLAMGIRLQNSMQSDFDYEFGTVNYTVTERENASFVSIPTRAGILFAKLNKSVDPFVFVNKIIRAMNASKISFESTGMCE